MSTPISKQDGEEEKKTEIGEAKQETLRQQQSKDVPLEKLPNGREIGKACPFAVGDLVTLNEYGLSIPVVKSMFEYGIMKVVAVYPDSNYPGDYPVVKWDIEMKPLYNSHKKDFTDHITQVTYCVKMAILRLEGISA